MTGVQTCALPISWFDAPVVLTIWVVLAAVCGLYLLGIFRTDHDYEEVKIGPGRLVLGSLMLFLSLYLAPALFGRPPQSKLWYSVVGLLPLDVNKLNPAPALAAGGPSGEQDATSKDPEKAQAEQTSFHGVPWTMSYKAGLARAREQNKPVLIDFTGANCANCRKMENEVMPQPEVVKLLKQFVTVSLYTDFPPIASLTPEQRDAIRETNQNLLIEMTQANDNPYYVAVTPDGQVLEAKSGFIPTATFTEFLNRVLNKHQDRGKVASAASR